MGARPPNKKWVLVLVLMLLFCHACLHSAAASEKPNIVMIIADDQTYRDFGFMGNAQVQTPHIDRLASQSARYVNGYVPTSVCSPSLATLLTGLYPHQHGIHYNHPPPGNSAFNRMTSRSEYERVRSRGFELIQSVDTLPRLLAGEGYRCMQTGKFWEGHYRNAGFTEGMTIFKPVPEQEFGGNRKLASGELVAHGNGDWGLKIGRETMKPIYDFIDDCKVKEQPFFVWYAPYLPHQPHDSTKKFYDLYSGKKDVPEHTLPYYASCSQFDETVGKLVTYVEDKGLAKNTIFVFVVDNGWTPSERREKKRPQEFAHTKESKRSPFEDGLRTPILIRWDGVVKPATHQGLVNSVDIVPTLLRATGLEKRAEDLPGINLMPSAKGLEKLDAERAVFGEIFPGDASSLRHPERDIAYRWVRQGDHKLIVPHAEKGIAWGDYLAKSALYDLAQDAGETQNLIGKNQTLAKHLQRLLDEWWTPAS
ncbi:MAG: sulfatase-like hydrolase/transferase [Verrucomicrobiota bacterium]